MGGVVGKGEKGDSSTKSHGPETKLEAKMVEAMQRRALEGTSMKSFNSIILKFPKIDESFRKCKTIFEEFDEDSNGAIDPEELKHCFHKLEVKFSEEEINDLFEACDINENANMGMKFNEFIVLLCLVYLLKDDPHALQAVSFLLFHSMSSSLSYALYFAGIFLHIRSRHTPPSFYVRIPTILSLKISMKFRMGLPDLEAAFEALVNAFVFLDKNKDGYVSKNEMVEAINETTTGERSSGRIAMKRFEEMDWDKNGMVTFKEFLFAFTRWIGIDEIEDEGEDEEE